MINYTINFIFICNLFFNALIFIPQAIKFFKEKSFGALSLLTSLESNVKQPSADWHVYLEQDYTLMIGFFVSFITCGM